MKQTGHLLVYTGIGTVLGIVFSLLMAWPLTPHMQYLKSEEVYQFSFIGMICGAISGSFISLLNPKHNRGVLPTIILGVVCSIFIMKLTAPLNTNWINSISPIGMLAGSILGLLIGKLSLPHKLDVVIHEKLIGDNGVYTNNSSLIVSGGAILGGTGGAILTVVAVILYIIFTPPDPFIQNFNNIQNYYFFIPIGSLSVIGYLFAKTQAAHTIYSMVNSFSEGIIFGVITGLMMGVLLLIFLLSAWVSLTSDNSLMSEIMTATVFSILIAFSSAMFGVTVSLTSKAFITTFTGKYSGLS